MQLPFLEFEIPPAVLLLLAVLGWLYYAFVQKEKAQNPQDPKRLFRRGGPDMAFSAGRDAAQQNARFLQVFIPMHPNGEMAFRAFYLDELGLMEIRAPNYPDGVDGFWAISGARQVYFGTQPSFPVDSTAIPTLPVSNLKTLGAKLVERGHKIEWDESGPYRLRGYLTDPGGTKICLIAG